MQITPPSTPASVPTPVSAAPASVEVGSSSLPNDEHAIIAIVSPSDAIVAAPSNTAPARLTVRVNHRSRGRDSCDTRTTYVPTTYLLRRAIEVLERPQ